jgi:nucleoid-associated protein YgaU
MGKSDLRVRVACFLVAVICLLLVGCGGKDKEAGDFNSLLRTGQQQMQKGRYREAVATFEKARSLNPEAPEPYLRLALVYEECFHDPETALRYYHRYQQAEKDEVKKEEIRGWIAELERETGEKVGREPTANVAAKGVPGGGQDAAASKDSRPQRDADSVAPAPVEESQAYKDLEARLASALAELRQLKSHETAESSEWGSEAEIGQRIKGLESENELLNRRIQEARADALRSEQAALQSSQRNDKLRTAYEAQIADLQRRLSAAQRESQDAEESDKELSGGQGNDAGKISQQEKALKTYAATLSSLQKMNDELKKENASLRSRLRAVGSSVRYHTVRAGETLKKIAGDRSVYGDSKKWFLIYQANRDKVRDPNKLTPGLVLVIPPG